MATGTPYVHYYDPADYAALTIVANGTTLFARPARSNKQYTRIYVGDAAAFDGGALTIYRVSRGGLTFKIAEWTAPTQEVLLPITATAAGGDPGWASLALGFAGGGASIDVRVEVEMWNPGDEPAP